MTDPDPRAERRARLRAPATLITAFLLAAAWLADPRAAQARKLTVEKFPVAWDAMRNAPEESGAQRISRTSSWVELKGELPESARHGHLHFGKPVPSLFRSPAASSLRGGGSLDTLVVKIALLRVDFQTDREGDRTTGDGHFLEENPDPDNIFIDPAPHDDRYFRAHLEAVSRYWSSITYGHVRFEGDVFPRGQRFGAYHLTDMADYGPTNDQEAFSIEGLTRYSRESLIAADADPDLVWTDYDVYFVVHAGADWQNDVLQDTPFDLPSFSITLSDSEVVVTDTGDTLTTMITHPESSTQDGFQVALNGVLAHEMGHQLGLLDIYDVETFAPTVAFYDVMDSGTNTSVFVPSPVNADSLVEVIGVLPTCVGAWNRWLVTFPFGIEPTEVKADRPRARLRAIQAREDLPPGTERWYRVPISDTEYYLVENRVDDLDGKTPDGAYNTALDQDDSTGVVLGPIVGDSDPPEISHNYDLLIDPGVLIWHIDERQALAFLSQGRGLNVDFLKRSVTIEEADGLVDIGSPFSPFYLGTDREAWWEGNNSNFTPTSRPNSDSNVGSPSGISITDIGPRGRDVTMDFGFTSKPRGWPMKVGAYGTSGRTSTTAADVDGDGALEVVSLGESDAFVFRYDDRDADGEVDVPAGWPATGRAIRTAPAFTQTLGDLDGDHRLELLCAADSGLVYAFGFDGLPYGGADSTGVLLDFGIAARPTWPPTPADLDGDGVDELYVANEDARFRGYDVPSAGPPVERFTPRPLPDNTADSVGVVVSTLAFGDVNDDGLLDGLISFVHADSLHLQRFAADGRRTLRAVRPLPDDAEASATERVWMGLADLDRKNGVNDLEVVLALESGWVVVLDARGQVQPGWPVSVHGRIGGPPAFGDLDGDGLLEIVLAGGVQVHALNYNGTEMPGWPALPRLVDYPGDAQPTAPAAIADVDGDGRLDVVCGFVDFTVRALGADGREIPGFAIPTGAPLHTAPVVLDANGDGRLDLFVQTGDGHVYGKILAGLASSTNPAWPMLGGGAGLHGAYDASRMPLAGSGPSSVLAGKVVIYPNPVRGAEAFRVRYTLGTGLDPSTQVDVSLYNVAGEKVRSAKGSTFANSENVVTFSSADLASGVYLCTLRARSGAREETAKDRVAVIR